MAGLRHDAAQCRQAASSESIRLSLGILTPAEKAEQEKRDEDKQLAAAKLATKGNSLFAE
jgi:hypothetical protein